MKKLLIVLGVILVLGLLWGMESNYKREAVVIESEQGIVTTKDKGGHIWQYKGEAIVGENVVLVMYDNHTSKITDDIVKGIK